MLLGDQVRAAQAIYIALDLVDEAKSGIRSISPYALRISARSAEAYQAWGTTLMAAIEDATLTSHHRHWRWTDRILKRSVRRRP